MIDGKSADSFYCTRFHPPGYTSNIDSLETKSEVGGMQWFSSQMKQGLRHGHGKMTLSEGRVFIGEFY